MKRRERRRCDGRRGDALSPHLAHRLFARPEPVERRPLLLRRQRAEPVELPGRKLRLRHRQHVHAGPDHFDVHADLPVQRHRQREHVFRMGQIEIQRRNTAARPGAPGQNEPRFAVRGRLKRQRLRRNADERPEHVTHQHAPRHEPPPQQQTAQSVGPRPLARREHEAPRRVQVPHRVQIEKPHVSAIQLARRFARRAVNDESRCSSQYVHTNLTPPHAETRTAAG